MLGHIITAVIAFGWSIRYQQTFSVKITESKRYWLKAINLALCYRGFADDCRMHSLAGAGKAAFFCCAYDVITDWRDFDLILYKRFETVIHRSLGREEAKLALELYAEEKNETLRDDGLSRGVAALEFVTKLIGNESRVRQKFDFDHLGTVLQIVDDVLDFEEDVRERKTNCLFSVHRGKYLLMLAEFPLNQVRALFPNGDVLWKVVGVAQKKAGHALSSQDLLPKNFQASTAAQIKI